MATLQENIAKTIEDFDSIEAAIEECGVDVPYDTDTSQYGNKVREVYQKALADSASVFNANTHYDFPSVGDVNVIYKAQAEKLIYQWSPIDLKYEVLGSAEADIGDIDYIDGGNASGIS